MDDPETTSQTGLVRNISPTQETNGNLTRKERTGAVLQSRRFHNVVFALIVFDCITVVIELCFTSLTECVPHREDDPYRPQWLQVRFLCYFRLLD